MRRISAHRLEGQVDAQCQQERAKDDIENSIILFDQKMSEEIVLIGLHNAIRYLGEITGETTTEDMLTRIFSTFCIGK